MLVNQVGVAEPLKELGPATHAVPNRSALLLPDLLLLLSVEMVMVEYDMVGSLAGGGVVDKRLFESRDASVLASCLRFLAA